MGAGALTCASSQAAGARVPTASVWCLGHRGNERTPRVKRQGPGTRGQGSCLDSSPQSFTPPNGDKLNRVWGHSRGLGTRGHLGHTRLVSTEPRGRSSLWELVYIVTRGPNPTQNASLWSVLNKMPQWKAAVHLVTLLKTNHCFFWTDSEHAACLTRGSPRLEDQKLEIRLENLTRVAVFISIHVAKAHTLKYSGAVTNRPLNYTTIESGGTPNWSKHRKQHGCQMHKHTEYNATEMPPRN